MSENFVDWSLIDLPFISKEVPHRVRVEAYTSLPIGLEIDATAAWYAHALLVRGYTREQAWKAINEAYQSPNPARVLDAELTTFELGR